MSVLTGKKKATTLVIFLLAHLLPHWLFSFPLHCFLLEAPLWTFFPGSGSVFWSSFCSDGRCRYLCFACSRGILPIQSSPASLPLDGPRIVGSSNDSLSPLHARPSTAEARTTMAPQLNGQIKYRENTRKSTRDVVALNFLLDKPHFLSPWKSCFAKRLKQV